MKVVGIDCESLPSDMKRASADWSSSSLFLSTRLLLLVARIPIEEGRGLRFTWCSRKSCCCCCPLVIWWISKPLLSISAGSNFCGQCGGSGDPFIWSLRSNGGGTFSDMCYYWLFMARANPSWIIYILWISPRGETWKIRTEPEKIQPFGD